MNIFRLIQRYLHFNDHNVAGTNADHLLDVGTENVGIQLPSKVLVSFNVSYKSFLEDSGADRHQHRKPELYVQLKGTPDDERVRLKHVE
jgi:hypothetical protein